MTPDDLALLRATARDALPALWGSPTQAGTADLAAAWTAAADLGWMGLAGEPAAALALAEACGAFACPLPVADTALVAELLPELADDIASGGLRPALALGTAPLLDAVAADSALVLRDGVARLHRVDAWRPRPGMARPAWVEPALGEVIAAVEVSDDTAHRITRSLQLALAVRALGAVAATAEEARAHAIVRRQFGRPIGAFGAVQQRVAATHVELTALRHLVDAAVADPDAADLAVVGLLDRLPALLFAGHHTLAAQGYFDEHPAPWRFRRAIADLSRCRDAGDAHRAVVERLLAGGLPGLGETGADLALRREVREVIAATPDPVELRREAAARGWFSLGWPEHLGGRAAPVAEQAIISEELRYARAPLDRQLTAQFLIGSSLVRHGSPGQQSQVLPLIARGELLVALGYSEAESGSDLASLRTRAVRDGDDWMLDGEKIWSTYADTSTHYWVAARTDPDAVRPQAGITMFLLPMDTPGITIHPITALSGSRSAIVELRRVRVPDSARVGELHGGWRVITDALAGERADMGGVAAGIHRALDDVCAELRARDVADWAPSRMRLAALAAKVQAARLLARAAVAESGGTSHDPLVAPSSAVYAGELAEEFGMFAIELLGPGALVDDGPGAGEFDHALRLSPMYVIGGGTNDVLRGLIARKLGLPRE